MQVPLMEGVPQEARPPIILITAPAADQVAAAVALHTTTVVHVPCLGLEQAQLLLHTITTLGDKVQPTIEETLGILQVQVAVIAVHSGIIQTPILLGAILAETPDRAGALHPQTGVTVACAALVSLAVVAVALAEVVVTWVVAVAAMEDDKLSRIRLSS